MKYVIFNSQIRIKEISEVANAQYECQHVCMHVCIMHVCVYVSMSASIYLNACMC